MEKHPDALESKHDLAVLYKEQGRYEEAERLLPKAVEPAKWRATLPVTGDTVE